MLVGVATTSQTYHTEAEKPAFFVLCRSNEKIKRYDEKKTSFSSKWTVNNAGGSHEWMSLIGKRKRQLRLRMEQSQPESVIKKSYTHLISENRKSKFLSFT